MTEAHLGLLIAFLTLAVGTIPAIIIVIQQRSGSRAQQNSYLDSNSASYKSLKTDVVARLRHEVDQRIARITELIDVEISVPTACGAIATTDVAIACERLKSGLTIITGEPGSGKTVLAQRMCLHINDMGNVIADTFAFDPNLRGDGEAVKVFTTMIAKRWQISLALGEKLLAQRTVVPFFDGIDVLSDDEISTLINSVLSYLTTGGAVALVVSTPRVKVIAELLDPEPSTLRVKQLGESQLNKRYVAQHELGPGSELIRDPSLNRKLYDFVARPLWLNRFLAAQHLPDLALLQPDELADILLDNSIQRLKHQFPRYQNCEVSLWLATYFRADSGPKSVADVLLSEQVRPTGVVLFWARILIMAPSWWILAHLFSPWWIALAFGLGFGLAQFLQGLIFARWLDNNYRHGRYINSPFSYTIRLDVAAFAVLFAMILGMLTVLHVPLFDALIIATSSAAGASLFGPVIYILSKLRIVTHGLAPWRLGLFMRDCAKMRGGIIVANNNRYEVQHSEIGAYIQRRAARIYPD